jgi:excinuclease UvrABC helicase subunit UvrB
LNFTSYEKARPELATEIDTPLWNFLLENLRRMEGEENKQETATEKEERKEADISLKELSRRLQDFADERDWEQYHSPRNLLLAMVRNITLY